tara:strand:- start:141 stop:2333 length:2193 start_codon:yes stop_codon:yes gene_type:complete
MSYNFDEHMEAKEVKKPKYTFEVPPQEADMPPAIVNITQYSEIKSDQDYYKYININGETCFWVRREEATRENGGKKKFTPYSYDVESMSWKARAWTADRVLFQEHLLAVNAKPVLILEGEKATVAATKLFKDYICVCWQGGSNAVSHSNFKELKDRAIVLWPDNDEEGSKAMHEVAKDLIEKSITTNIKIVQLPKELPKGWDVADQLKLHAVTPEGILNTKSEYVPDDKIWKQLEQKQKQKSVKKDLEQLVDNYAYVRDLGDFFEMNTYKFVDKTRITDWFAHATGKDSMASLLIKHPRLIKVHSYMTHAGLAPGVVNIAPGQIIGIDPGKYLNNYRPSNVAAVKGDVQEVIDYYRWFVGPEEWKIVEQVIAFCVQYPGEKMKWCCSFTSAEGGGKGVLGQIVAAILGQHNVRTQVSFSQLTGKHATILEGKQFIIINELDLSSTKSIKSATNSLKTFITDPTLIIEPKNKPQQEIPNFCNFFIYSNEDDCLWLKKDSRRYFVVNIPHTQQTINAKLAEGGFKDRLLAALDPNGPGPSALKHYFEKEVIIENKKIFHDAAPRTNALEDLIDRSKSDAVRMMEECLQNETWPFANHMDREKDQFWGYSGLVNRDEFFNRIRASEQFKGLYFPLKDCEKFLKDNCIPWPNGEKTKQIILMDKAKRRVYLIKDYPIPLGQDDLGPSKLSEMTEGQLGSHYMHFQHLDLCSTQVRSIEEYYREKVLPPKPNINL